MPLSPLQIRLVASHGAYQSAHTIISQVRLLWVCRDLDAGSLTPNRRKVLSRYKRKRIRIYTFSHEPKQPETRRRAQCMRG